MNSMLLKRITIYLTVDQNTIDSYFNAHDPSPIYKRQLNQDFEEYISGATVAIKRYSIIRYKLVCKTEDDKEFTDPLIHAIRRHYSIQKSIKEAEFKRFKKSSYKLLAFSLTVVMLCHFLLSGFLNEDVNFHSAMGNALEVFSWVILWKPIDKLIFYWNPYLKEISVYDRLINADVLISNGAQADLNIVQRKYA